MVMPAMIGRFGNFYAHLVGGGTTQYGISRLNSISFLIINSKFNLILICFGLIENGAGAGWYSTHHYPGLLEPQWT